MRITARLRAHRKLGTFLLIDFINATPETAAKLVEREAAWARDLIPLAEPFGDGWAARLETLTPMHPHEQLTVAGCALLDEPPNFNLVRVCHAVRMYRLDGLFQQLSAAPVVAPAPAKKTGRKPGHGAYDDAAAVAEMVRLVATGMPAWSVKDKAKRLADPRGISDEQNGRRIYKKYMRLHG